ncbi:5-dehydro-2-deoxygluconokinase [Oricola cellulosilytica]|uniref:5-dehydro-2-deoxygluconokinase n=1 Tax=Oricola cellulosilytica TaxID=1429082 RepID=A0A4R0P4P9_9HYPH|nr:5-dehydro-2-deoxygluconokinase [Oricola cellulosilytica]TCD11852.1 5-dehydro-2-deoxygluconokinase [Oricola cellulosilytica]
MTASAHVIDGIARNDFLVIGRVGMDLSPQPAGVRTEDAAEMTVAMGGSSANIAAGIVKLGGKAALVTCVSDDSIGRYCLNQLDAYGIDRKSVRSVGGEFRNSLAVYETRVDDHQSVIYRNGAADFQMSRADVEAVDYPAYGALITAGTVFAAEPSRDAAFHAFDLARKAGLPIIFDVDYRPYSWPSPQEAADVLSRAGALSDVIVGNDEEFGFMAGGIDKGLAHARKLAETAATIVVYKMGDKGAITFAGGEETRTGIFPVTALKPTGAGDSFMAGLMASLADGFALHESVLRGSACAAIVVGKPGCAPAMPDRSELDTFLADHAGPRERERKPDAHSTL